MGMRMGNRLEHDQLAQRFIGLGNTPIGFMDILRVPQDRAYSFTIRPDQTGRLHIHFHQ